MCSVGLENTIHPRAGRQSCTRLSPRGRQFLYPLFARGLLSQEGRDVPGVRNYKIPTQPRQVTKRKSWREERRGEKHLAEQAPKFEAVLPARGGCSGRRQELLCPCRGALSMRQPGRVDSLSCLLGLWLDDLISSRFQQPRSLLLLPPPSRSPVLWKR